MASIEVRSGKGGPGFRVVWRRGTVKESLTLHDEQTAKRCKALVEGLGHDVDAGGAYRTLFGIAEPEPPPPTGMTLGAWADVWFPAKTGVQIGTVEKYRRNYELHIAPLLVHGRPMADYELIAITPMVLRGWVAALGRARIGVQTMYRVHAVLHQLLRDAVREGHLPENPAQHTELPREDHDQDDDGPMRILSHTEAPLLLGAMRPGLGSDVARTLLGTGLRFGELTALQTRDVDLLAKTPVIKVQRSWKQSKERGWYYGPPKSKRSRRTVSVSEEVVDILARRVDLTNPEALVFGNGRGTRLDNSAYRRDWWDPAVALAQGWHLKGQGKKRHRLPVPRAAGLLAVSPTPHDLRHTHASWLIMAGHPLVVVSRRLGHDSVAFTERRYVHLLQDEDDALLADLDSALRAPEVKAEVWGD